MPTISEVLLGYKPSPYPTLGYYRRLAEIVWGDDSGAVRFLDENIEKSSGGATEPVLAHESQVIFLLSEFDRIWSEKTTEFAGKKIEMFERKEHG